MRRVSRSSWTWSTTTPRRAITGARPCRSAASTTPPTTVSSTRTSVTTSTTPGAGTASTSGTRTRSSSSWTHCGIGCSTRTWTGSGSTSRRPWPGSCTTWTGCPPSSTWSSRTRWSRRSSSSPSPGTSARAATRWVTSRRCGVSGTASTATPCGTSGAGSPRPCPSSPPGCPARATCTRPAGAAGTDDNRSWNCGAEGLTADRAVLELRSRQRRNFLATLFCSQGVPMLLAGDELGRTQGGNNNAYCQDNEVSWVDWSLADSHTDLLEFARELAAFRSEHPVFRRRRFFRGGDGGDGLADIAWLTPSGREMADQDWKTPYARAMMVFLNGNAITEPGPRGEPVRDDTFLILLSANRDPVTFTLPGPKLGRCWAVTLDSAAGQAT